MQFQFCVELLSKINYGNFLSLAVSDLQARVSMAEANFRSKMGNCIFHTFLPVFQKILRRIAHYNPQKTRIAVAIKTTKSSFLRESLCGMCVQSFPHKFRIFSEFARNSILMEALAKTRLTQTVIFRWKP